MYKKILLPVLLICMFSVFGAVESKAEALVAEDTFPKVSNVVLGNWNNLMDPRGCVLLDEDNYLKIKAVFTFAVDDLTPFPAIHFTTQFDGGSVDFHPAITNANLVSDTLPTGDVVYVYTTEVFVSDFASTCSIDPNTPISFDYDISLVDENEDPYPLEDNPELFTFFNSTNTGIHNSGQLNPVTSYEGTKDLCCYTSSGGTEGLVQNTNDHIETAKSLVTAESNEGSTGTKQEVPNLEGNLHSLFPISNYYYPLASPNPFSESIKIKFEVSDTGISSIDFWDINGRLVHSFKYTADNNGIQEVQVSTDHLEPGLYYCTIKNETQFHSMKVLKLNR